MAVMRAVPAPLAVASPVSSTVATAVLFDDHRKVGSVVNWVPVASSAVAVNCCVWPTATDADVGIRSMLAAKGGAMFSTMMGDAPSAAGAPLHVSVPELHLMMCVAPVKSLH